MVMQVATLDILTEKARFDPQVARAIGEAIELEVNRSRDALATSQELSDVRHALGGDITELRHEFSALRHEFSTLRQEMKADLGTLRQEVKADFGTLRQEVKADLGTLRQEFKADIADLRSEFKSDIARLEVKLESNKAELVRWVFLAIMGQSTLLAGLMYFFLQHMR